MQMGFYFDQSRCTGCHTCAVACKDWNDVPAGPARWRWVTTEEWGKYPNVAVSHLALSCLHCAQPTCVPVCPTQAITKGPDDGIVVVDREKCLPNCFQCRYACPYEAPQFGAEPEARMQMCNFCPERLAEGKKPTCVDSCPLRALDAGPLEEIVAKYGDTRKAAGFADTERTQPSLVVKPAILRTFQPMGMKLGPSS